MLAKADFIHAWPKSTTGGIRVTTGNADLQGKNHWPRPCNLYRRGNEPWMLWS
jgi:hypothetical protein